MKKLDFNRGWTVRRDGSNAAEEVNLPHDAMLCEPRSPEASTGAAGGYFPSGKYRYQKKFVPPPEWEGKTVLLECEAVYQNAAVYLNGQLLCRRPYGYTNFYADLSGHLRFAEENTLTILADNADAPNSRWYSGSGIIRPVFLHVGGKACIPPDALRVTTLDAGTVRVDVRDAAEDARLLIRITDGDTVIAQAEGNHVRIAIPDAKLWSESRPQLYTCQAALRSNDGSVLDEASVRFGMRTLSWADGVFRVNGVPVKLRGACIHHDNGILGAAGFADAERRRVRILKEAGFNAIRSAHNPMSRAMLDACDELGMYVMDEAWDMWLIHKNPYDYAGEKFKAWWKEDLSAMAAKDYNHPSVVMYSVGNEISELGLADGWAMCREIVDFLRSLDDTRPLTAGLNLMLTSAAAIQAVLGKGSGDKAGSVPTADTMPTSIFFNTLMNRLGDLMDLTAAQPIASKTAEAVGQLLDIRGYNYATSRYRKDCAKNPTQIIVGSETLPKALCRNWQLVKAYPNLAGDFMWTGWDYLGEAGIGTVTYQKRRNGESVDPGLPILGGAGVIDICGNPRPEVGRNRSIWGLMKRPTIGVEPVTHAKHVRSESMWRDTDAVESWSWEGCEGERTDIVVYADAEKVGLGRNGKMLSIRKVKGNKAVFRNVEYQPGSLVAVAYDKNGKKIGKTVLRSAEGAASIRLRADRTTLQANGQDLCFLDLEIIGENGVVKAASDTVLAVEAEGAGTLQAFGSAWPITDETFTGTRHTTYYGRALAVIRAGYEPGKIRVRVSSADAGASELTISCVPCTDA